MSLTITPLRTNFAGQVSGIDITRPLNPEQATAIEAAMDQVGVLVFHDQHFTDDTQLAFSRALGIRCLWSVEADELVGFSVRANGVTVDNGHILPAELGRVR